MAFDNGFTAVTGATFTAAQYNTYDRDNRAAVWVYTTQGDIAYATNATALARLGIQPANHVMTSDGTKPVWTAPANLGFIPGLLHALAYQDCAPNNLASSSGSFETIASSVVNIVTTRTCTIRMFAYGAMAAASTHNAIARGVIGGVADAPANGDQALPFVATTSYSNFAYMYKRTGVAAGTISCSLQFKTSSAGSSALFDGGALSVEAITE